MIFNWYSDYVPVKIRVRMEYFMIFIPRALEFKVVLEVERCYVGQDRAAALFSFWSVC